MPRAAVMKHSVCVLWFDPYWISLILRCHEIKGQLLGQIKEQGNHVHSLHISWLEDVCISEMLKQQESVKSMKYYK